MAAGPYLACARSDADDRLVEAEEPLAGMQLRSGGELPGTIATPALLELVRKARRFGLKLARPIQAQDEREIVTAWVEVTPNEDGSGGCEIGLANWQAVPLPPEDSAAFAQLRSEIDRELAELTARLDPAQGVLSVDSASPELQPLVQRMRAGIGRPWTDFIEVAGSQHHQPLHWRLLDGAKVTLPGSAREWKACLLPLGGPEPGSAGFELHLTAEQPPAVQQAPVAVPAQRAAGAAIGRDVAPVLRQPIARIIANAETIRTRLAGPLAEEYSNYAADIATAGQHLLALIDDLSDLEVVEAQEFTTAPDRIDLADVARRAVGILGVRAQERGISIDAPDHGETLPAIGEFRRVLQVLLNLIGNAIRYSPEGSQIWVRLDSANGKACVTIADQGQGLSAEQQAKVFEKFERLGRSGDGGSGLGLYISRRLARAMGGELSVESAPGKGARFTLSLPAQTRN
ncbi:MAG: HAMP domain-containing sensor histidine kinase [Candidatus Andeanibacterium colombiense]|uniref:histidine kinase n=1 Tax=Candidatus Andeanibacterium colombiense TaxID=3121345 RepID=A0AAJ6BPB2_9SPHN|nr:MAG: HAMP domain-containing sensor histidine kinase [Sphingomonadaceae bacterium]